MGRNSGKADEEKVVIYTNGDEEATAAMETSLKDAGYEGKYVLQSLGSSELGGKLLAEGDEIEADVVTMSSYFIESVIQYKSNGKKTSLLYTDFGQYRFHFCEYGSA